MGKYVIESKFENTRCFLEVACENREPYFFINSVDSLTPYTEPDMEQVRKEAYQKGYETGYKDGYNEPGKNQQEAYQRGLNDAREGKASCQFCEYEMCSDRADPCRSCACNYMNFFEPKKQEEMDGLRQNIQIIVDQCGYTLDEIAEVLAKMKETNNG